MKIREKILKELSSEARKMIDEITSIKEGHSIEEYEKIRHIIHEIERVIKNVAESTGFKVTTWNNSIIFILFKEEEKRKKQLKEWQNSFPFIEAKEQEWYNIFSKNKSSGFIEYEGVSETEKIGETLLTKRLDDNENLDPAYEYFVTYSIAIQLI